MSSRAPGAVAAGDVAGRRLRRTGLGTADLVFFVVAAAAPLTVVAGVVPLAIRTGGLSTAYGYLVPAVILLMFAVGFTAMSPHIKNAGAFYAYISRGIGKPIGVGGSFVAALAYNAMTVCLLAGFAVYGQGLLESFFGVTVPWWMIAAVGVVGVGLLGYFKVTMGAKVLGIALILEVLVLIVYQVATLGSGDVDVRSFEMFNPSVMLDPGFGAMLVLTAGGFIGFEATALYAEEVKDPERTVQRATYIAIGFLGLFYTFSVWCLFVAYTPEGALAFAAGDDVDSLTFVSMSRYVGVWLADVGQLLLCTSAFAAALAFHNAASRYHFTMAREGLLPRRVGRISARHGSPIGGVVLQIGITVVVLGAAALAQADPYLVVFLWSSAPGVLGVLLLEMIAAVAIVAFFWKDRRGHSSLRVIVAPALSAVGLAVLIGLAVSQMELLTAASNEINVALLAPIPILFAVGIGIAWRMRSRDPRRYAALNSIDVEAESPALP
ncbi:APC family permease [Leucobacter allii]|uniref:APC family permease n=1 Tax=Leucobacter allii TaxID=2932247 RepID=A0ABY4FJZ1_9MICO|nr:APC family permease [Leucobacter allii]UOQ56417.1 APC family permease [Leucobacter allii]